MTPTAKPWAAAKLNYMWACTWSCGTPVPKAFMTPRLYWPPALPCSTARAGTTSRFNGVLGHAQAGAVHDAEIVLGVGVTVLGKRTP